MTLGRAPLFMDSGVEAPASLPAQQPRTDQQLLVSICQLLEEVLAELKRANARTAESHSSASVKTSARNYDIEAKSYADGQLDIAMDEAIATFARAQRELSALQMAGWVNALEAMR